MSKSMNNVFFAENLEGESVDFDTSESMHAAGVFRISKGDRLILINGRGTVAEGSAVSCSKRCVTAEIRKREHRPLPYRQISMYIGMPDKYSFERAVENLSALGILKIVPLITEKAEKKWFRGKWEKQKRRLAKKAVSSCKQSLNPWLPEISDPLEMRPALSEARDEEIVYTDMEGKNISGMQLNKPKVSVFTGPPGGFTESEASELKAEGAAPLNTGLYRLRTELAAAAAGVLLLSGR